MGQSSFIICSLSSAPWIHFNNRLAAYITILKPLEAILGGKDGAVVKALAYHQCGPGSNPGVDAICGLNLLLVLSLAPRGFSPGTPVSPSP